jgi:SAM-dependent methyltransferase
MTELFEFRGYQIPVHLVNKTGGGTDTFEKISDWHIAQVQKYIGIKPTDNVVEIGCGIGRDAIPLTTILAQGTYLGTDTIGASIRWCIENISSRCPNFRFVHHDIRDALHNPKGMLQASDIILPVIDQTTDLILLHSVFTHMFKDEIVHYLREFRRILKPSGRVWASCFIANDSTLAAVRNQPRPGWGVQFRYTYEDGCFINSEQQPRAAVAYEDKVLMDMIELSGLQVDDILWGSWSGQRDNARSGQDTIILRIPNIF